MSFIVSFQGQFRPYKLPETQRTKAKNINPGDGVKNLKDHEDDDFENILAQEKGLSQGAKNQRQKGFEAYKKQSEKGDTPTSQLAHAKDIMSSPVFFMRDSQTLGEAKKELVKRTFRHFPILNDQDTLCGIISDRDILGHDKSAKFISEVMHNEVLTALEDTYVNDLARIMLFEKIHCLPILNDERQICGIVTNADILMLVSNQPHLDFKI